MLAYKKIKVNVTVNESRYVRLVSEIYFADIANHVTFVDVDSFKIIKLKLAIQEQDTFYITQITH